MVTSPLHPLFNGAVSLKGFRLHLERSPLLNHFGFPNNTSFELSVVSAEGFRNLELLDFLETSPMLQVVHMKVIAPVSLEGTALDLGQEWTMQITSGFGGLLKSMGPLEELIISHCDMRPHPFIRFAKLRGVQYVYPPIKALTISYPSNILYGDLTELANAQRVFECMKVSMSSPSTEMEERLRPWVVAVDCCSVSREGN